MQKQPHPKAKVRVHKLQDSSDAVRAHNPGLCKPKRAAHKQMTTNINELKGWENTPPKKTKMRFCCRNQWEVTELCQNYCFL